MVGSVGAEVLPLTGLGLDGDGLAQHQGGNPLRCCDGNLYAHRSTERHAEEGETVEAQVVGDSQHVQGDGVVA